MDVALLFGRLLLAAVFVVSGLAKLGDRGGPGKGVGGVGLPAALAGPVAAILPLVELAVAILLLPVPTAAYGALGAPLLLGIFIIMVGWNLARGRRPDCH